VAAGLVWLSPPAATTPPTPNTINRSMGLACFTVPPAPGILWSLLLRLSGGAGAVHPGLILAEVQARVGGPHIAEMLAMVVGHLAV
jgi:hypothetical protein